MIDRDTGNAAPDAPVSVCTAAIPNAPLSTPYPYSARPAAGAGSIDAHIGLIRIAASRKAHPTLYSQISAVVDPMQQGIRQARSKGSPNLSQMIRAARRRLDDLWTGVGNAT